MSHTSKSPPLKYTTADLPTDLEVGSLVLDSTTSEHKVFNGSSWDVVEGGVGTTEVETKTQTIVWEDDQGNLDQLIGDIPVDWKRLTSIKRLYIGTSCTTIGSYAFGYCSSLTGSLTISNSVTSIGDSAFYSCTGLTGSLTIPDSVTTIGSQAFYFCNGLTGSLTIGNSVTSIGSFAFTACISITSINILATTAPTIAGSAFFAMISVSPAEIHVPVGATGYAASYDGLTVVYDL